VKPAIMFLNPMNAEVHSQSFLMSSRSKIMTIIPLFSSCKNFP
jgi:hypothetical protein